MKYSRINSWMGSAVITEDGKYKIEKTSYGMYYIRDMGNGERLTDTEGFAVSFSRLKDAKAHLERIYA